MQYHSLLRRQLKNVWMGNPPVSEKMNRFLMAIDQAYLESDVDRKMLERSLELSSQELLEANADLRALFHAFPDVLFRLNQEGIILDVKSGHMRDLLKEPSSLMGCCFHNVPEANTRTTLATAFKRAKQSNEVVRIEYTLSIQTRREFFEARFVPVNQGEIIAIVRNITQQRLAQDTLAEERRNLEHTVETRTRELRSSLNKLEEANQQLAHVNRNQSRLLSRVSHELRTPLNGVLGYTELLLREDVQRHPAKSRHYMNKIEDCGRHLLALVNDLLDMAKVDAGAMELHKEPIEVCKHIEKVVDMMAGQEAARKLTITTDMEDTLPSVQADQRKFCQIVLNLMSNAVKFTPPDGHIIIRVFLQGLAQLRVEVADTGSGITPEDCEHVFSEFGQGQNATETDSVGTGIGLALSRRLVELHGGEIGVESEVGVGSTFWFTLPIEMGASADGAMDAIAAETCSHSIAIVENDAVSSEMIAGLLEMHNHKVIVADSIGAMLASSKKTPPELLLVDADLLRQLADNLVSSVTSIQQAFAVPIIAMIQDGDETIVASLKEAGCADVLDKPVDLDRLLPCVTTHVSTASCDVDDIA